MPSVTSGSRVNSTYFSRPMSMPTTMATTEAIAKPIISSPRLSPNARGSCMVRTSCPNADSTVLGVENRYSALG